jgi:FG-GAP repeat
MSLLAMSAVSAAGMVDTNAITINQPLQTNRDSDWQQIAKLSASDAAPEHIFGYAVDLDGDYAVIGQGFHSYNASAYIFKRTGSNWTQEAILVPSDSFPGNAFGYSVAISDDTVIIGAPAVSEWTGAAYVFIRAGTLWIQQAKLTPPDGIAADEFGFSVDLAGDTAVIGASYAGNGWSGKAYVFKRNDSTWTYEATLTASDGQPEDQFGWSVAIQGDTAVIGAVYDDERTGSAYVFTRTETTWAQQAKLMATDAAFEDAFGVSLAIDSDTIVIGAGWKDTFIGAAYIYTRAGTIWAQQAKINASDGTNGNEFGMAVAISGDTVAVGARFVNVWTGAAYIFTRSGTTWMEEARINASDGENFDQFGWSIAIDGNTVITGAPGETSPYTGAAYVFYKPITQLPALSLILKGGLGLVIRVDNKGSINATNVNVTCEVSGGFILFGKYTQQKISNIGVNQSDTFKTLIVGLGPATMKVSAVCDEGVATEKTVNASVFLILVYGVK